MNDEKPAQQSTSVGALSSQPDMWMLDESLRPVKEALCDPNSVCQILSFDFFDTLVARLSPEPVNAFIEIGRRLLAEGQLRAGISAEEFRHLRETAERNARKRKNTEGGIGEVTLRAIYDELTAVVKDPARACVMELDVEKEWCYVNPSTFSLLEYARNRNLKIIVLSDTYFSSDDLREILAFNGCDAGVFELLLTSSETGMAKWDGSLFRYALTRLEAPPAYMLHIGDNAISDYRRPAELGVLAFHYYRTTPYVEEVLRRERQLAGAWPAPSAALDSVRVLAQRLNTGEDGTAEYFRYGAFVLGPVMARYADWCVQEFRSAGVTRVLALMREGLLFSRMLTSAAQLAGVELEVIPFYTSRQASSLASLGRVTIENLDERLGRRSAPQLSELLAAFGLDPHDERLDGALRKRRLDEATRPLLLQFLTRPDIRAFIEEASAERRRELVAYLRPFIEGVERVGLVDLGWGGTIQCNLGRILQLEGLPNAIMGCYLATGSRATNLVLDGMDVRAYLGNLGTCGELMAPLFRSPEIFEQAVNACIGSTLGYRLQDDGGAVPVLDEYRTDPDEQRVREALQKGILTFQTTWQHVRGNKPLRPGTTEWPSPDVLPDIDRYSALIVNRLVSYPTQPEAEYFGRLQHDDNFGSDAQRPICDEQSATLLGDMGIGSLYADPDIYWPQGTVARQRPDVVRQLAYGWSDSGVLGTLGAWERYRGEVIPRVSDELRCVDWVARDQNVAQILTVGWSAPGEQLWLIDLARSIGGQATRDAGLPSLVSIIPCAEQEQAVEYRNNDYLQVVGIAHAPETLSRALAHVSTGSKAFVIVDGRLGTEPVWQVLNYVGRYIGSGSTLAVFHGAGDNLTYTGDPHSSQVCAHWLEQQGRSLQFSQLSVHGGFSVYRKADDYATWIDKHQFQHSDALVMAQRMETWLERPTYHLIVPLRSGEESRLASTLDSLGAQLYGEWTLSVVSTAPCPDPLFDELDRLRWLEVPAPADGPTAVARAVEAVVSDWVAVVEPGDCLAAHALLKFAAYANERRQWCFVYPDDDTLDSNASRRDPHFKPDFNLDLLRSMPYMGSLCPVRRDVLLTLGGYHVDGPLRSFDLALRVYERLGAGAFGHIGEVLYHRAAAGDGKGGQEAREVLGQRVLAEHLERSEIAAQVGEGPVPCSFRVEYRHARTPLVSIIVPTRDRHDLIQPCLETLLDKTGYAAFEVIVVDNDSVEAETLEYLNEVSRRDSRVRVMRYQGQYNYAAINNAAAENARGEYLLLLNNDTMIVQENWLDHMMSLAHRADVGIVGPRLVFPDQTLQHAGIVLGMGANGVAEHVHMGLGMRDPGQMNRAQVVQNVGAVTGACLLIRRSIFEEVGRMDQDNLKVNYNDVDLCLKSNTLGYRTVWTPYATLVHLGSASLTGEVSPERREQTRAEVKVMFDRWLPALARDGAYNRNLSLASNKAEMEVVVDVRWDTTFHDRPRVMGFGLGSYGSYRYRVQQPLQALETAAAAECAIVPFSDERVRMPSVSELMRAAPDVLLLHNTVHDVQLEAMENYRRFTDAFIVFSQDDLMTELPPKNPFRATVYQDIRRRLRQCLGRADRLVVSTEPLADAYRKLVGDVRVVPNYLERYRWGDLVSLRRRSEKPRVGWAGAQQHGGDLGLLLKVVEETADEVEWVFFGMALDEFRPFAAELHAAVSFDEYPVALAALNLDLAVAPLEHNKFNEAKSNLRLLEYGVLGWPVLCSDVFPYNDSPVTRVANNARAWVNAIRERIHDLDAAEREGDALRRWVLDGWMLEDHLDEWLAALNPSQQRDVQQIPPASGAMRNG